MNTNGLLESGKLRNVGLMLAAASLALLLALCAQPASALAKSYSLPSKMTVYSYENGKSHKQGSYSLKYTKSGLLKSLENADWREFAVYYKKGRAYDASYAALYCTVKYDKKGRISKVKGETDENYYQNSKFSYQYYSGNAKKKVSCKTSYVENGKAVKTKGAFSVSLDKSGYVTKAKSSNANFKAQYKFKYKKDGKGRVKSITVKRTENGKTTTVAKYKFAYNKAKKTSSKKKMLAIVNAAPLQYADDFVAMAVFDGKKGYNPMIEYLL